MSHKEATGVPKECSTVAFAENEGVPGITSRDFFTKWNSFRGVEGKRRELPEQVLRKARVRGSKETHEFTAKMGHCPEGDGARSPIYRVILPAVPRLHAIQPELVVSLRAAAHKFRFIRNRIGAMQRDWLD